MSAPPPLLGDMLSLVREWGKLQEYPGKNYTLALSGW